MASQRVVVTYAPPDRRIAAIIADWIDRAGYEVDLDGDGRVQLAVGDDADQSPILLLLSAAYLEEHGWRDGDTWQIHAAYDNRVIVIPIDDTRILLHGAWRALVRPSRFHDELRKSILDALAGRTGPPPAVPPAKSPRRAAPKPSSLSDSYSRGGLLDEIRLSLMKANRLALVAQDGLAGVGTTQVAADYIQQHAADYDLVAWIEADRAELVTEQFARLAGDERITRDAVPIEAAAAAMKRNLQGRSGRFLLVFDDAVSPEVVLPWIPGSKGQVLVTSRHEGWARVGTPLQVPLFKRAESLDYLQSKVPRLSDEDAARLAGLLGDVPLALSEAARSLNAGHLTVDVLARSLVSTSEALRARGVPPMRRGLLAATEILMEQLAHSDPNGREAVQAYAVMARNPLPVNIFAMLLTGSISAAVDDPDGLRLSAQTLRRFGWVDGAGQLSMHAATKEAIAASFTQREHQAATRRAEQVLTAAQPDDGSDPKNWRWWRAALPHLLALEPAISRNPAVHAMTRNTVNYLRRSGDTRFADSLESSLPTVVQPPPAPAAPIPENKPETPVKGGLRSFLLLATEWSSAHGGLSTLNRHFALALAAYGHRVCCVTLDATPAEIEEAGRQNVILVRASDLSDPSNIPATFTPEFIVGHSRLTGPAADLLTRRVPGTLRLHVIHMWPDAIESYKPGRTDTADPRQQLEIDLGSTAHKVIAVGPRLTKLSLREITSYAAPGKQQVATLQLDPGCDVFDGNVRQPPMGGPWKILLLGRADDPELKGIDLAAKALGQVVRSGTCPELEFVVRGVRESDPATLKRRIREWAGLPSLKVTVRNFSSDVDSLDRELMTSTLVLMPSRAEGFGLSGLEAILAGTPALISDESGLGDLLKDVLKEDAGGVVIPVRNDDTMDIPTWHGVIAGELRHRDAAFQRAEETRRRLAAAKSWKQSIEALTAMLQT